jgi:tetratricopeptide (TPR) repeat protein
MAAADNDLPGALAAYRAIDRIPQVPEAVQAEVALNKAIIALALRRPGEAADLLQQASANQDQINLPGFAADLRVVEGLIAWGDGKLIDAERIFAAIAREAPQRETAHHYLGQVREVLGDHDGAARALNDARMAHHVEAPREELAVQLFWVNPVEGGIARRL